MNEQLKDSLNSVPLIERVTNLRSALLILVVMLWVDLSLVAVTKTNLLTHPWQESKQQIHYGWVAILSGAFLAWYVLLVPMVNFFAYACINFMPQWPKEKLTSLLSLNEKSGAWSTKHGRTHGELLAYSLKKWGVDKSDELAIRLATEQLQKDKETEQSRANLNHVAAAFIALMLAEAIWPESFLQMFVLPRVSFDNLLGISVMGILIAISLAVATSWWITRPFQGMDSYVYYPKAVSDNDRRRP